MTGSQHVKLLSFAVEAAKDEVGILLDGTGKLSATPPSNPTKLNVRAAAVDIDRRVIDVTIEDLIITASTRPGLLAASVALLQVDSNRIAMANVRSKWPAVWISGIEMRLVHNWVGVQSSVADREWLPVSVQTDLAADSKSTSATFTTAPGAVSLNPGGIQIAGPSSDVFVLENEIENSGRNAITLGSVLILDNQGNDTGLNGVTITIPGPCDTSVTIEIPGTPGGQGGGSVVAGGKASQHPDQPESPSQLWPVRDRAGRLLQSCAGTGNHHDREPHDCREHHLAFAAVAAFAAGAGHVGHWLRSHLPAGCTERCDS